MTVTSLSLTSFIWRPWNFENYSRQKGQVPGIQSSQREGSSERKGRQAPWLTKKYNKYTKEYQNTFAHLCYIKDILNLLANKKIQFWIVSSILIGPRSDHSLPMSVTDSLTHWLTDWLTDDLVEDLMNWPFLMESNI